MRYYRLLLLILLVSLPDVAWAQSAGKVMSALHERYADMTSMRATFSQVTSSSFMDRPERLSGTILLSGNAYRVETASQTIVTDGTTSWVYNRLEDQVLINDYIADDNTFSLTDFLSDFDSTYSVVSYESEDSSSDSIDILDLEPKDEESAFSRVIVHARRSDRTVTQITVFDLNDVRMDFSLNDIEFNPVVPDGSFQLSIPEGIEVIDLREGDDFRP